MTFASPWFLTLLVLPVVAGVMVYRNARRARRDAIVFADGALLAELQRTAPSKWRRRVPIAGMLTTLTLLAIAAAEPQRMGPIESASSTVVLTLDVSRSMLATDVVPTRIEAAQQAALDFIAAAPSETKIGIVTFSSRVDVLSVPTRDREALRAAVGSFQPDGGTAIGDAIFTSLALLDTAGWVSDPTDPSRSIQLRTGAIVVMSDGATNSGRPDADAAAAAAAAGVPVYTVAFGTDRGVVEIDGQLLEVPAAPEPLRIIAETTKGSGYEAFTGSELSFVFEGLAESVAVERGLRSFAHLVALLAACILFATALAWVRFGARI